MKKGDCVLFKYEKPRLDSTSAHSDQDFHCLSMYSTVSDVSLSTQLKMPILRSLSFSNVDVHLMFLPLCWLLHGL